MWAINTLAISCFISLLFYSCSNGKDVVMPGTDGVNRITIRSMENRSAEVQAIAAANRYCSNAKQSTVFLRKESRYVSESGSQVYNADFSPEDHETYMEFRCQ